MGRQWLSCGWPRVWQAAEGIRQSGPVVEDVPTQSSGAFSKASAAAIIVSAAALQTPTDTKGSRRATTAVNAEPAAAPLAALPSLPHSGHDPEMRAAVSVQQAKKPSAVSKADKAAASAKRKRLDSDTASGAASDLAVGKPAKRRTRAAQGPKLLDSQQSAAVEDPAAKTRAAVAGALNHLHRWLSSVLDTSHFESTLNESIDCCRSNIMLFARRWRQASPASWCGTSMVGGCRRRPKGGL